MTAQLIRDIREEVIQLLFNRYVFRTHQEIVRRNPRLQGRPRSIFHEWGWIVYGVANAVAVRRLASSTYQETDVNIVRLLDILIRDTSASLWSSFTRYYPNDVARVESETLLRSGSATSGWEAQACKRLLGEDRKLLINAADGVNQFASKRVAHSVPSVKASTTFAELDDAIDLLKTLVEKYTVLTWRGTGDPWLDEWKHRDLLQEMKSNKLDEGWDSIFLEAWTTPEILTLGLGEMLPPRNTKQEPDETLTSHRMFEDRPLQTGPNSSPGS